jgi:hypothetical protein
MDLVKKLMQEEQASLVVVKNGQTLLIKQSEGIQPLLTAIDTLQSEIQGSTVGDRVLGKAAAFLCVHAKVGSVYTSQATKTALAILIRAGIPGQAEKMVPYLHNREKTDVCPFEKMLTNVDSAENAYQILKQHYELKKLNTTNTIEGKHGV